MKLIIDIPEEEYALCKKQWDTECLDPLMIAVKYGTPLDDLRTVKPQEPKTGHWIYWHTNGFGRKIYKCSKCNWDGDTAGYRYCPNCGAKMVEPQERSKK